MRYNNYEQIQQRLHCRPLPSLLSPASKGFSTSFGLFQNGFRPIASPAQTYDEDLAEIILADQLGFRGVWISEQHGEPIYINKVDCRSPNC